MITKEQRWVTPALCEERILVHCVPAELCELTGGQLCEVELHRLREAWVVFAC